MSAVAVARSTFRNALTRYAGSTGLWFLLLVGLLGARFWIPRDDGTTVQIAIEGHLPAMTSAMLGTSLGVVISTILLPFGFLYLRSNTTRRQPWQIEEVTAASRVAVSLGSFAADTAVFALLLAVITLAGCFVACLLMPLADVHVTQIAVALWLIGAPVLMGLAAMRAMLDALPWTRRGLGDVVFFCLWLASLMVPLFAAQDRSTFGLNLLDFGGVMRPLMQFLPPGTRDLQIGFGGSLSPGRIFIDILLVLLSKPYIEARLAWIAIAILAAAAAGILYRPHTARRRSARGSKMLRWLSAGAPPPAQLPAVPAALSSHPLASLIVAELRLIFAGRLFLLCGALVAVSGLFVDFRHAVSPAVLLLMIFGLTAQAARTEARNLLTLTATAMLSPVPRRAAFVMAGLILTLLLSAPALLAHPSLHALSLALAIGLGAPLLTILVTMVSRSAFAPRILLLMIWYGYISAN